MKQSPYSIFLVIAVLVNLSACSTIKPYFPDKQKDYRYSHEISRLRLPSDLTEHRVKDFSLDPELPVKNIEQQETVKISEQVEETRKSQVGNQKGRVKLVGFDGGGLRLMVTEEIKRAWYIVGKALSRQAIEVTERNQNAASFTIQFDPAKDQINDGSLWNEFEFLFGEDRHLDQKFHVILADNTDQTEIIVTDENGIPQSKGPGLSLLVVLFESIKEDLTGTVQ